MDAGVLLPRRLNGREIESSCPRRRRRRRATRMHTTLLRGERKRETTEDARRTSRRAFHMFYLRECDVSPTHDAIIRIVTSTSIFVRRSFFKVLKKTGLYSRFFFFFTTSYIFHGLREIQFLHVIAANFLRKLYLFEADSVIAITRVISSAVVVYSRWRV